MSLRSQSSGGDIEFDINENVSAASSDGMPRARTTFQISFEDLEILHDDELGSGSFSHVCKGIYCGTEVAIKKIKIPKHEPEMMKYLKREVLLLNALKHPHIVQFLGWSHPEDSEYLLLVEEYVRGGDLSKFLSRNDILVSWDTRISICLDIARTMLYLHKQKVIYRDLKSENVVIDDTICPRVAKLCDFGLARSIDDFDRRNGPPMTICGTDEYMAPEVILGMDYDERSDVFSYGMLLLECIVGPDNVKNKLERKSSNFFELDTDLIRNMASKTSCPRDLLELALFCCAYEPNARPDFNEVLILLLNVATEANSLHYEEIKIDEALAAELSTSLSKTLSSSDLLAELARGITPPAVEKDVPAATSGTNSASTSSNTLRKLLEAPSIFSLDAKAEYVRVESMVDSYTHWNVRIGPGALVKDVCEKLAKKIDEKYKVVQLYVLQGKKKVLLGSDQTISNVQATFKTEKGLKFGVNYFESLEFGQPKSPIPIIRAAKKDASPASIQQRKSSLFGTTKKGKKNLPATPLIKSI